MIGPDPAGLLRHSGLLVHRGQGLPRQRPASTELSRAVDPSTCIPLADAEMECKQLAQRRRAELDGIGLRRQAIDHPMCHDRGATGVPFEVIEHLQQLGMGQGVHVDGGHCVAGGLQRLDGCDGVRTHNRTLVRTTDKKLPLVTGETTVAQKFSRNQVRGVRSPCGLELATRAATECDARKRLPT